jgi:dTDP-4-amino-4,6-dideoxygalactose transaminase
MTATAHQPLSMKLLDLAENTRRDHRGALTYIEHANEQLPFIVQRIFWLYGVTAPRGGHSHKLTRCALLCVSGTCQVTVKNGNGTFVHSLDRPSVLLVLEAEDWHLVEDMSKEATLVVFCSTLFTPNDYVTSPPPVVSTTTVADTEPAPRTPAVLSSHRHVPFFDLMRDLGAVRAEMDAAYARVMDSGTLVLGTEVREFEREFAAALGNAEAYAIGVASGTSALELSLYTLGIGSVVGFGLSEEVILTANAGVPTASAIDTVGATPVFVDVCRDTGLLDMSLIADALSPRTRAIVVIHLYGCAFDVAALREHLGRLRRTDVAIVEDCAQAFGTEINGTRVGLAGDIGCFSFYPTKNLGAFGDGGMIVTQSREYATRMRRLRQYGWDAARVSECFGVNSRLDEMQAAMLRVRLRHITTATAVPGHSYHLYTVLLDERLDRETVRLQLREHGVVCGIHYGVPTHAMPRFSHLRVVGANRSSTLTNTDEFCARTLSLPLFPGLNDDDVTYAVAWLAKVSATNE